MVMHLNWPLVIRSRKTRCKQGLKMWFSQVGHFWIFLNVYILIKTIHVLTPWNLWEIMYKQCSVVNPNPYLTGMCPTYGQSLRTRTIFVSSMLPILSLYLFNQPPLKDWPAFSLFLRSPFELFMSRLQALHSTVPSISSVDMLKYLVFVTSHHGHALKVPPNPTGITNPLPSVKCLD